MKEKFVLVPTKKMKEQEITPIDLFVYGIIQKYQNYDTHQTFVSLKKISEESKLSINTIRKSIAKLDGKYFKVTQVPYKNTVQNLYDFGEIKKPYEMFSHDFLDTPELAPIEKGVIMAEQHCMFKEIKDVGKMTYSLSKLSEEVNMPESSLYKVHRGLHNKGVLTSLKTDVIDPETGVKKKEFIYALDKVCQQIAWKFYFQDKKLQELQESTEKEIENVKEAQASQEDTIKHLQNQIDMLTNYVVQDAKNKGKDVKILLKNIEQANKTNLEFEV